MINYQQHTLISIIISSTPKGSTLKRRETKLKKKEMVHSSSVHLNEFCQKTLTAQHLITTNAYIGKI